MNPLNNNQDRLDETAMHEQTPKETIDELLLAVKNIVCDAADALQSSLERRYHSPEQASLIVDQIMVEYLPSLQVHLDQFEDQVLKQVFGALQTDSTRQELIHQESSASFTWMHMSDSARPASEADDLSSQLAMLTSERACLSDECSMLTEQIRMLSQLDQENQCLAESLRYESVQAGVEAARKVFDQASKTHAVIFSDKDGPGASLLPSPPGQAAANDHRQHSSRTNLAVVLTNLKLDEMNQVNRLMAI